MTDEERKTAHRELDSPDEANSCIVNRSEEIKWSYSTSGNLDCALTTTAPILINLSMEDYHKNMACYKQLEAQEEHDRNHNLEQHLAVVEKQIKREIPDENFDGIAVIDVEEFRPLYSMNWGEKEVYKKQSKLLIESQYPHFTPKDVEYWAEIHHNKAAKRFFVETIKLARRLRPKAKWGYYDYPFCNYKLQNPEGDYECSTKARSFNDQMFFIWNVTGALFPSIYLNGERSPTQNFRFIQALLQETKRVASCVAGEQNRRVNIYAYSKFEYDPYKNFTSFYGKSSYFILRTLQSQHYGQFYLTDSYKVICDGEQHHHGSLCMSEDLCNTIKQAADLGTDGVVLWSTSKQLRDRCSLIADFMTKDFGQCLPTMKPDLYALYGCHCDEGFKGKDCTGGSKAVSVETIRAS
ncbi:hyaluronoglucosaminidase [Ancylostoma duodenale]|uniref:Hyaluronidase n=1 Tax=Ancylostoma duodenale TaxID=51022 RepID=A0A0C2GYS4_9BILA|nr:hyaluronoglucosaminidase [Ancylostoma duodenale]